ncbi:hypothetical protein ACI2LF_09535 [Kribbella sp. NPDC020789]
MKYVPLEFFGGVAAILAIMIVAGKPLRHRGSPHGPAWRYVGLGGALFVVAALLNTFPPHSVVLAVLVMLLATGFFTLGIAILGGGYFGFLGAAASGLTATALFMAPTPVGLAHFGRTLSCRVRDPHPYGVRTFTAECPDGRSYDFTSNSPRHFPGGRVNVLVDPHGLLQAQFVGQQHAGRDLVAAVLMLLTAAGVVVAAAVTNRRKHGQVDHVVNPRFTSGP